jgi:hypothetical protein
LRSVYHPTNVAAQALKIEQLVSEVKRRAAYASGKKREDALVGWKDSKGQ